MVRVRVKVKVKDRVRVRRMRIFVAGVCKEARKQNGRLARVTCLSSHP